ncbi:calumenin-A [Hydra vulgaris]|uniref:calumenin-A n=1 Tax=Hydra vulgaris TaxID=6087 RepID=UPI0001923AA2|nr:calumenin-A [Hydra vulgaris]
MHVPIFILSFFIAVFGHEDHKHGISESEHYQKGGHNINYDHDAFLGKSHGHDFDTLEPSEAKRRLKIMIKEVDKNGDGFVSLTELHEWIEYQRKSFMRESIDMIIDRDDDNKDKQISWKEYKYAHYGKWDDEASIDKKLREKINNAKHKFNVADEDFDGKLNREEYMMFRHPEESTRVSLQEIAIDEIIDEMDVNKDRLVDLNEFLGQYVDDRTNPPDWVVEDRKHFAKTLDLDGSGKLDRNEMRNWVLPKLSETKEEANHLIKGADDNNDNKLSYEEILDHYNLFVGSTATDHGKALKFDL